MGKLNTEVKQRAREVRVSCQRYGARLRARMGQQGLDGERADRLKTAVATGAAGRTTEHGRNRRGGGRDCECRRGHE